VHGVCAADGLSRGLGEAEVRHLALRDQVPDGLRGLLDRRVRVDAMLVEQVDVDDAGAAPAWDTSPNFVAVVIAHPGRAEAVRQRPKGAERFSSFTATNVLHPMSERGTRASIRAGVLTEP